MTAMTIIAASRPANEGPAASSGLSLRNEGDLDLTFIGSGSAFSKKFFQNNILLVKGEAHVMVDCGTRTPEALFLLGHTVNDIRTWLVTHSHADHIGGLEEVMLQGRYVAKRRPRIIIPEKMKRILWTMSLRGGSSYNEVHDGKPLEFDDLWETVTPRRIKGADREAAVALEGDLEIRLFRTKHIPDSAASWEDSFPSYGLLLDRRVLFTSDTRFDPELLASLDAEFCLETIFHDCQFYPGGVHASLDDLGSLPAALKAKTWLMHYGDNVEAQRDKARALGFAGFVQEWTTYRFAAKRVPAETCLEA
jgi:ribonuclease BN (tRNA processing enzyme)